ncbi:MAG TPA: division/cell wall cluster transcriptional repressor MraZ [Polyangiales bacterium]|nr:division/cell wall cluster transcriptional repressor MraZ [Polyangiales bacterium]
MFRGTYEHAIDAKGRTSFPSKFRELLSAEDSSKLVLTTSLDSCVVAYPMRAWNEFQERLMKLPQFDKAVRDLRRIYISNAVDADVDSVGRLLVPPMLREYANLKRDAVWAGNGNFVELWDKEKFRAARFAITESEERREEMAQRLAELGL